MLWTFGEGRSNAAVNGTVLHGRGLLNLPQSSYLQSVSFILGQANASPSNTQGGSPVRGFTELNVAGRLKTSCL
jgi:hypothetical protein